MVITQFNLCTNICFYKYAHNSSPKGSPDMIVSAFDVKFYIKAEGMPPKACRTSKQIPTNKKVQEEMCPRPIVRPSRGSVGRSSLGRNKRTV